MKSRFMRKVVLGGTLGALGAAALVLGLCPSRQSQAGFLPRRCGPAKPCEAAPGPGAGDWAGAWYWLGSPDEEKRVVAGLFNRYCIRCHGVDGRGVWDIPGIPDFTNPVWQACRSDPAIARIILEGRGAVMPSFRGVVTIEEAYGLARYIRTFLPGTEVSRPDRGAANKATADKNKGSEELPPPKGVSLPDEIPFASIPGPAQP